MKILVLSDSHGGRSFMRECIAFVKPDAVVHLGDYYSDAEDLQEEFPQLYFYMVPGNCDANRGWIRDPEIRIEKVCGVMLYFTHGHRHMVKQTLIRLVADARAAKVQAVLFGHTHQAHCEQLEDGLWVLNPGAGGSWGGTAGVMEVESGQVCQCHILRATDLKYL